MLRNYFKTAWRTLTRHKGFTVITVMGLALALAVCLLILTFAWDQKSYDDFHAHGDRIVRILSDRLRPNDDPSHLAATPAPLAEVLQQEVPGIEATLRIGQIRAMAIYGGQAVALEGLYAEPSFFTLFDFELQGGDGGTILAAPNQLILSKRAAENIFGEQDPLGQSLTLEGQGEFIVAGLLAEPPGKSHLKFDVLASFATLAGEEGADLADWKNSWRFATYLLVEDGAALERLNAVLPGFAARQYAGQEDRLVFRTQALGDISLGPVLGNEISSYSVPAVMVYFLAALGLLIMLAAGFNYVSLSVARALRRAQEVGVRKVVGARRGQVVFQFLSEAVLVALLALVGAYLLLLWLVPAFNSLTFIQMARAEITPAQLTDPRLLGLFVLFSVGVGVAAGLYPALRLSKFQPVHVLKGLKAVRGFSGRVLRHGLTGAQFALALFFVITTSFIYAQVQHLIEADYGFVPENILNVDLQGQDFAVLREELLRHPSIEAVSATSKVPASGSTRRVSAWTEGMDEPERLYYYAVDPAFRENLGLELLAGRDFSAALTTDTSDAVILNETALRTLDLGTPAEAVGTFFKLGQDERAVQVVGVVRDYHYDTMTDPIRGMVWQFSPTWFRYANVRARSGALEAAEAHLAAVWQKLDPVHPLTYERFYAQLTDNPIMQAFRDFAELMGLIAGLAVVISCLGLLGMATYTVETRVKEVGLRKVLGASRRSIVLLLSKGFLLLVGLAALVVVPLAWLANDAWLQIFASRVPLSPWLFAGCVLLMAGLALAVIATQTLRAASVNPVESLRYE